METLRDKIEAILAENGVPSDKVGTIAGSIIRLGRKGEAQIVHTVGPNGFHKLKIDDEESKWTEPTEIIKLGDYIATTDAFINILPQLGKVYALRDKDFRTESVQSLS